MDFVMRMNIITAARCIIASCHCINASSHHLSPSYHQVAAWSHCHTFILSERHANTMDILRSCHLLRVTTVVRATKQRVCAFVHLCASVPEACLCVHVHACAHECVCLCVCTCVHACMHLCVRVCVGGG